MPVRSPDSSLTAAIQSMTLGSNSNRERSEPIAVTGVGIQQFRCHVKTHVLIKALLRKEECLK